MAAAWPAGESKAPQPCGSLRSRSGGPLSPFPPCPQPGTRSPQATPAVGEAPQPGGSRGVPEHSGGRTLSPLPTWGQAGPRVSRWAPEPAFGRPPGRCLLSRTHTCQVAHRAALCLLGRREGLRESAATRRLPALVWAQPERPQPAENLTRIAPLLGSERGKRRA